MAYHISKDGTPGICRAQAGRCPLGGASEHFETEAQAYEAAQSQMESKFSVDGHSLTNEDVQINISNLIRELNDEPRSLGAKMTILSQKEAMLDAMEMMEENPFSKEELNEVQNSVDTIREQWNEAGYLKNSEKSELGMSKAETKGRIENLLKRIDYETERSLGENLVILTQKEGLEEVVDVMDSEDLSKQDLKQINELLMTIESQMDSMNALKQKEEDIETSQPKSSIEKPEIKKSNSKGTGERRTIYQAYEENENSEYDLRPSKEKMQDFNSYVSRQKGLVANKEDKRFSEYHERGREIKKELSRIQTSPKRRAELEKEVNSMVKDLQSTGHMDDELAHKVNFLVGGSSSPSGSKDYIKPKGTLPDLNSL